jgi:drug/metabolite transporter (DMT)-like permease
MIASYTVVDGVGVRLGPLLPYIGWMFFLQGCGIVVIAAARYPRTILVRLRPHTRRGLLGGLISLVAYCLVLWAQTSGALAPIAALRESSIVFGAIIGAVFLGERLGLRRALAAIVVLGGIVLLSTSV